MRRFWIIYIGLLLLTLGAITAWRFIPHPVDQDALCPLYLKYKDVPGIAAGFIKDFRVNDSTVMDVTTLQAVDTAAWHRLTGDFGFPKDLLEYLAKKSPDSPDSFIQARIDITDTRKRPSGYDKNCRLLIIKASEMSMAIYNNRTESDINKVTLTEIKKLKK